MDFKLVISSIALVVVFLIGWLEGQLTFGGNKLMR